MLDEIDRKLLSLLSDDARQQYAELGHAVHLSAPAVHARVKKLEQAGVIQRFTVRLDPDKVGKSVCAFIRVMASSSEDLARDLQGFPELEEFHAVAGEECVLAKARTATPAALEELLQRIRKVSGVHRTVTTVVLRTYFERATDASISI